jgi:hypothetical protein
MLAVAEPVLFVGPTAWGLDQAVLSGKGIRVRPPVARGDIDRLLARSRGPGVMILCDGLFQSVPAVSHAELCRALDAGWQVWGVSSLGAIRAHELRDEGMRGFGWVHGQFARHADFTDDEMCLLHFPEPPFFPVSVPLVNLRYALARRSADLGIAAARRRRVLSVLSRLWFGDRTASRMREALLESGGLSADAADDLLRWMAAHPIKTLDLQALLQQRPWRAGRG